MSLLAGGLITVFYRVLVYPGLLCIVIASSLASLILLYPAKERAFDVGLQPWRILLLWVVLPVGAYALPVPGSSPLFVAGDALFSLAVVHVAVGYSLLPSAPQVHRAAAWTLSGGAAALATLSNYLWQDWARLSGGDWYEKAVAVLGALCVLLWGATVVAEAMPGVGAARGPWGTLARMAISGVAWFSSSAALSVELPPLSTPAYLSASVAVTAGVLAVGRAATGRPWVRRFLLLFGPAVATVSLAFAVFSLRFLAPGP